uniref:Eosinophil peroxidase n=1 Tax=Magallana gigas TaxID=29159 RepID=K1R597_MAGGI
MEINCDQYKDSAYRSADGSCNSLDYPYRGAAVTPQPRYQPAQYDDGLNSPRTTGKKGDKLPSTRLISNKLFRAPGDCTETDHARTLMVMAWGQFIDHDLAFTPVTQDDSSPITCCEEGAQSRPECFPIPIPSDDPRFTHSCMELVRSASAPCQAGAREQTNEITSFIDGGVVYGDSIEKWAELVDAQTGGMLTSEGELLPAGGSCKLTNEDDFCQKAGQR